MCKKKLKVCIGSVLTFGLGGLLALTGLTAVIVTGIVLMVTSLYVLTTYDAWQKSSFFNRKKKLTPQQQFEAEYEEYKENEHTVTPADENILAGEIATYEDFKENGPIRGQIDRERQKEKEEKELEANGGFRKGSRIKYEIDNKEKIQELNKQSRVSEHLK